MKRLNKILSKAAIKPEDLAKQIDGNVEKDPLLKKIHQTKMERLRMLLRF